MRFIISHTMAKDGLINCRIQVENFGDRSHAGFITLHPDEFELLKMILHDGAGGTEFIQLINFDNRSDHDRQREFLRRL